MKPKELHTKKPLTVTGNDKQLRVTIPKTYGINLADKVGILPYEDYVITIEKDIVGLSEELTTTKKQLEEALEKISNYEKEVASLSIDVTKEKEEDRKIINDLILEKDKLNAEILKINTDINNNTVNLSKYKEKVAGLEEKVNGLEALLTERNDKYLAGINALKINATNKVKITAKETEKETINAVLRKLKSTSRFSLFMKKFNVVDLSVAESISNKSVMELKEDNKFLLIDPAENNNK